MSGEGRAEGRSGGGNRSSLPYLPALDGIRALALIAILGFHAEFAWASGAYFSLSSFFTLSGYLITALLLNEYAASGRIDLRRFWARRFRRLMPGALLALLGVALFGSTVADATQLRSLLGDGLAALFYVANWRFLFVGQSYANFFSEPSPVLHFWSLSVEEQYYLFYPLVFAGVMYLGRGSRATLFAVLGVLALGSALLMNLLYVPGEEMSRVYYGTDTRAAELLAGALLAIMLPPARVLSERARLALVVLGSAAGAAMLMLWTFAAEGSDWVLQGGLSAYSILTALLLAGAIQPGRLRRMLSPAPLRWLGRISYGVYLYHWPVFLWLSSERTGLDPWPLFGLRLAVILSLAQLSYSLVEAPVRFGQRLRGKRAVLALVSAVSIVSLSLLVASWNAPESEFDFDAYAAPEPMLQPQAGKRRAQIWVVGDSVAATLWSGLEVWGQEHQVAHFRNFARLQCGLAQGGEQRMAHSIRSKDPRCDRPPTRTRRHVKRARPDLVLLGTSVMDLTDRSLPEWDGYRAPGDADFDRWLLSRYREVADLYGVSGAPIAWLNAPCVGDSKIKGPLRGSPALSATRIHYVNDMLLPRFARDRSESVHVIDLFGAVCPGGEFSMQFGDQGNLRPDGMHFSKEGARALANWLGPELMTLIRDKDDS